MNAREIKELVRHYNLGISPRRLGQHFLVDGRALARIAQEAGAGPGDRVVEIGAGLGALTEELLGSGATVYAVERDSRFLKVLTDRFRERSNLQLVRSDVLKLDLASYALGEPGSLRVIGNIPYSLTSPILEFLQRQRRWVRRVLLTIQREVAQRILAEPGTKEYSSITLFVRSAFEPSVLFNIPPGSFYPRPQVTSSVLRLEPLAEPPISPEQEERVLKLVRGLFTHRRKTLLNALRTSGLKMERQELLRRLQGAGIRPDCRPETLGLPEVVALEAALTSAPAVC
ncbi:MAG: ribosomal RNA small subunit methyltransferase A [Candidatus Omnitrophica bacterium]|nr:ribosomal RNA small subunit methyltransferase A [Candidatus Omnitrophota bacterium]